MALERIYTAHVDLTLTPEQMAEATRVARAKGSTRRALLRRYVIEGLERDRAAEATDGR